MVTHRRNTTRGLKPRSCANVAYVEMSNPYVVYVVKIFYVARFWICGMYHIVRERKILRDKGIAFILQFLPPVNFISKKKNVYKTRVFYHFFSFPGADHVFLIKRDSFFDSRPHMCTVNFFFRNFGFLKGIS